MSGKIHNPVYFYQTALDLTNHFTGCRLCFIKKKEDKMGLNGKSSKND